jgi:hypothetical protein
VQGISDQLLSRTRADEGLERVRCDTLAIVEFDGRNVFDAVNSIGSMLAICVM